MMLGDFKGYKLGNCIDENSGTIFVASKDGQEFAVKHISKERITNWITLNDHKVPLEVFCMYKLKAVPGVIQLIEYFDLGKSFVIVMEMLELDLYYLLTKQGTFDESRALNYFRQLVETVIACHQAGIVHRDIKIENIMIDNKTNKIKLIDFGAARLQTEDDLCKEFDGTLIYCPPEYFTHGIYHGQSATVWSLGMFLYSMLHEDIPFKDLKDITEKREIPIQPHISSQCRDLILKCMSYCSDQRLPLYDILRHPALVETAAAAV